MAWRSLDLPPFLHEPAWTCQYLVTQALDHPHRRVTYNVQTTHKFSIGIQLWECRPVGERLEPFSHIVVCKDIEESVPLWLVYVDILKNDLCSHTVDIPIFDLVFSQNADQLSAKPALRRTRCPLHEQHDRSVVPASQPTVAYHSKLP